MQGSAGPSHLTGTKLKSPDALLMEPLQCEGVRKAAGSRCRTFAIYKCRRCGFLACRNHATGHRSNCKVPGKEG